IRRERHAGKALDADRIAGVGLVAGRSNGADAEIVGARARRAPGFLLVPGGSAEDEARGHDELRLIDREVVLAEVASGGAGGQRDVESVVDDEGHAAGHGEDAARRYGDLGGR